MIRTKLIDLNQDIASQVYGDCGTPAESISSIL